MRKMLMSVIVTLTICAAVMAAESVMSAFECDPAKNLVRDATIEVSSAAGPPGTKYSYESMQDHDISTHWASKKKTKPPVWIKADFGEPETINTIAFIVTDLPALYMTIKSVRVEFSDGSSFTRNLENRPGRFLFRFEPRQVQWFKFIITEGWQERNNFGIKELLAFNDPDEKVRLRMSPKERWQNVDLTPQGRDVHPCVYITPEDVERGRQRVKGKKWAADFADAWIKRADQLCERDTGWIHEHAPEKGALYARGNTGCPICGASWGSWAGANCSFDRPGTVKCRNGHILPDEDHPDDGTGWEGEDGRTYYFVASYNAWVVETYYRWSHYLAFAYTMTGEEKYAETCAAILDALAEIYPTSEGGSEEYPCGHGRLSRPGYQTARVLVTLVNDYDQIFNSPALDKPSVVEGMTRQENIEKNLMKNGAKYCYEHSFRGGLGNGIADYIRGSLSVGCLLGIPAYIDWAVDGPFGIRALVGNNVDRDGRYHETALCYSRHTRNLYLTYAEPLLNYRSERYPEGLNLYDDEHFRSFYVLPMLSMDCVGHWPRYGDCGPDTSNIELPVEYTDETDIAFAEKIIAGTSDPQVKKDFATLLNFLTDGHIDRHRDTGDIRWLMFNAEEVPETEGGVPERLVRRITDSTLMGQKGMAFLRTPNGPQAQAALLRYGPTCNHSHFDDLNLNYYALGYEVTYDLGYGWGNTHTQVGWAKQTASHNLVLVNEAKQRVNAEDGTGGSLHTFAAMPGMQVVDAEAKAAYRSHGLHMYRRCIALAGEGPNSYLLDIFNVRGGHQHDYMLHALSEDLAVEGVELSDPTEGSVAGPEYDWGARQMNDGFLSGIPHKNYMVVEPYNGLGFLMHPQKGAADRPVHATWKLPADGDYLRATVLPEENTEIVTAWAPGIYPNRPKADYLMVRRGSEEGLSSTFVTVMEPYGPASPENTIGSMDLMTRATTDDGIIKHISGHGLVLFQTDEPGGVMDISLQAPETGEYYLTIRPYTSPGYGRCQFLLDGEEIGKPYSGNAETVHAAGDLTFGPVELDEGDHTLGVKMLSAERGNLWMGIGSMRLAPQAPAEMASKPFIKSVRNLAEPGDVAAVEAEHTSGIRDRFIYDVTGTGADIDGIQLDGSWGALRTDGGEVLSAHLVGKSLSAGDLTITLDTPAHTGKIVRIDYDRHLIYVDVDLPTDGRLQYQAVKFANPAYSRNSAYTIYDVRKEGDLSVIDLGPQRLSLGEGTVYEIRDATTLESLTPHGYVERPSYRFFQGKALADGEGEAKTHVTSTTPGDIFTVGVESTEGFERGEKFYYLDLQSGDSFTIDNFASIQRDSGLLHVRATDTLTVATDGQTTTYTWDGQIAESQTR